MFPRPFVFWYKLLMKIQTSFVVLLLLLPAMAHSNRPPFPVYDGCVQGAEVRIMTGVKQVLDRDKKPVDLKPYDGKRIRFKGYLHSDSVLVMLDEKPTVVGACREAPHLPRSKESIDRALKASRKIPTSKAAQPAGPCLAAVVRATSAPLHSGEIESRQLLSNYFQLVEALSGPWPKTFKLSYSASVPDNERAVMKGERVILIPVRRKAEAYLFVGAILEDSPGNKAKVQKAAKACDR